MMTQKISLVLGDKNKCYATIYCLTKKLIIMNNKLQVLNPGVKDGIDILSPAEELLIEGGDVWCQKGYSVSFFGKVTCECGYVETGGPHPGSND